MVVTSDTPEYCLHLLDRVSELVRLATAPVPREVTDLTTEGHRMCAHGQTRERHHAAAQRADDHGEG